MSESPDQKPVVVPSGIRKGLTNYGDTGFSLFLRKAFIKGAGYTDEALDRTIVGIVNTGSGYNPCHGNAPQLIEAVKRGDARRKLFHADEHVSAQPHVDGHGGDDSRTANGRRGTHRRL